jgi:hypothetical protein
MPDTQPPADRRSWISLWRSNRITMVLAAFGVLALLALTSVALRVVGITKWDIFRVLTDSDEAPIRVRNGSLDIHLLSANQEWEDDNGEWKIKGARRYKEEFEVTVAARAGAACGPSHTATGAAVVVTYSDNTEVRFQSAGKKTKIKPGQGTGSLIGGQRLQYGAPGVGFIKQVAVGTPGSPTPLCTFTQADQLDHILILNVPEAK